MEPVIYKVVIVIFLLEEHLRQYGWPTHHAMSLWTSVFAGHVHGCSIG